MTVSSDIKAYHASMQEPIRQSIQNAIEWRIRLMDNASPDYTDVLDADTLIGLLERAVSKEVMLGTQQFVDFLRGLLTRMADEGPGGDFRQQQEFIAATDSAIRKLDKLGKPVSDLLLIQAAYYANIENNGERRLAVIKAAESRSKTVDERLRALLVLAKFFIDVSDYRRASEVLDKCLPLVHVASDGSYLLPDILMTRGITLFYSDHHQAQEFFADAIKFGQDAPQTPDVMNAVGTAYRYLGRIRAAQRQWEEALDLMVRGQQLADNSRGRAAFYHLRLAEVMIEAGSTVEAKYHLEQSSQFFRTVQQSSTGQIQLDLVFARLSLRQGERSQAKELLWRAISAAREHSYPRGELLCLADLMRLQVTSADFLGAARTLGRGLLVFLRNEAKGGFRQIIARMRTAAKLAPGLIRLKMEAHSSATTDRPSIHCPCGADHSQVAGEATRSRF